MKPITPISPTPPLMNSSIFFHLITPNTNIIANATRAPSGKDPELIFITPNADKACITKAADAASKANQCLVSILSALTSSIPTKGKSLYSLSLL